MSLQKSIVHLYPVLWTTLLSSPHMQKEQESIEGRARTTKFIVRIKTKPLEKLQANGWDGVCIYSPLHMLLHIYIYKSHYAWLNLETPWYQRLQTTAFK